MAARMRQPVAVNFADGSKIVDYHPRLKALEFLREKIAEGRAGCDPFQPAIFIVHAGEHEKVATRTFLWVVGAVLTAFDLPDGTTRFRAVVETDVRAELGLDGEGAPLMDDEPLASRAVDAPLDLVGVLRSRPQPDERKPLFLDALREAKAAYDRRFPHGPDSQLVMRTDGDAAVKRHERDYLERTIETVRNHSGADNCWPQWANIFADEIERLWQVEEDVQALRSSRLTTAYTLSHVVHAMRAAWIEWKHGGGAEAAMGWIENTLDGPDQIPQEDAGADAQAYFDRVIAEDRDRETAARASL